LNIRFTKKYQNFSEEPSNIWIMYSLVLIKFVILFQKNYIFIIHMFLC
jgi:hypothetical protein